MNRQTFIPALFVFCFYTEGVKKFARTMVTCEILKDNHTNDYVMSLYAGDLVNP